MIKLKQQLKLLEQKKYDLYQNAITERINGILMQEFIGDLVIQNLEVMKAFIKNSIIINNQIRSYYFNFYLIPYQMHLQNH